MRWTNRHKFGLFEQWKYRCMERILNAMTSDDQGKTLVPAAAAPAAGAEQRKKTIPKRGAGHPWRRRLVIAAVAVIIVAGIGLASWQHMRTRSAEAKAAAVETVVPTKGSVERSVESSGTVAANLEIEIKCRASGEITKLPFDISQAVKKGDLLCQLDPTDEQLSVRSEEVKLAQAQAKLAQAKATLEQSTQNLETTRTRTQSALESAKVKAANAASKADRQRQLVDQKLGSQEEQEAAQTDAAAAIAEQRAAEVAVAELAQQEIALETKRQDVNLANADVQAAQITLDQAKKQLDYTTVVAPIDGTVSSLDVQIGTIVASGINNVSGGTTIMTIADLSRVFVEATVDEADIGTVQIGQAARVTVDSYAGRTFTGEVVRVAVKGVSESNVTTFEVKVEVTDSQKAVLKPLMSANVVIVQAQRNDILTLPTSAITRKADRTLVKLASGEEREVRLGIEGAERVEVTSGVTESDRVIVNNNEQPSRWRTQSEQQGPPG